MSVRNQRVKIMFLGRTLSTGGLPPQYPKQSSLPILFSSIFSTLLALTLCVASLFLGDAIGAVSEIWVPPRFTAPEPQGPVLKPSVKAHSSSAQRQAIRQIDLGSVPTKDFEAKTVQASGGPTKAGFSRDIKGFMTVEDVRAQWDWQPTSGGGQVALLSFTSPGALALRLAIDVRALPQKAELRFFKDASDAGVVVSGARVLELLQSNRAAGDPEPEAGIYWSPVVDGEAIGFEIYLPKGVSKEEVVIAVPRVSHLFLPEAFPSLKGVLQPKIGESASCNNDATCDATWAYTSNAVARMIFSTGGFSYLCTGTLLNDQANTGTPYFLSANHCISTQSTASTLITYWFYRSSSCNSGILNPGMRTLNSGATLLYQSATTDTSFMRLNAAPPSGATFSGWTTSTPVINAPSTGLHNPRGDLQKISYGNLTGFLTCTDAGGGSFTCQSASSATGTFENIQFTSGTTEGGSSGSGIFLNSGKYLYGQLYGGNSSCSNLSGSNIYGRFDKAYANGNFSQWLASSTNQLVVTKVGTGSGTVVSNPSGISCGSTCSAPFQTSQTVTLTPTAAAGSYFSNWVGDCDGGGGCSLSMTSPRSVTANFLTIPAQNVLLTVSRSGLGSINSVPSGISCSGTCTSPFPSGSTVTLTAAPVTGYYFSSWGGACTGSGSCTLVLTSNQSVTATFLPIPANNQLLTVSLSGGGSIVSSPAGLSCSSTCSYPFPTGTLVSLIASPNQGQTFMGWTGSSCSGKGSCSVLMNANQTIGGSFISTYVLIMPAINLLLLQ